MYYSCVLGPQLQSYVNMLTDEAPKKIYECEAELQFSRAGATAALQFYNDLTEFIAANQEEWLSTDGKTEEQIEKDRATFNTMQAKLIGAGQLLQKVMKEVVETAEKAHNIYLKNADILDVAQLPIIVNQIVEMAYTTFGPEGQHLAEQLQKTISEKLRLPNDNHNEGTTRRADDLIDQMASSLTLDAETVLIERNRLEEKKLLDVVPQPS